MRSIDWGGSDTGFADRASATFSVTPGVTPRPMLVNPKTQEAPDFIGVLWGREPSASFTPESGHSGGR